MVPEYWSLGEDLMEEMRVAGLGGSLLEGVAVDIHDILQIADDIQAVLRSDRSLQEKVEALRFEARHLRWHSESLEASMTQGLGAD
jgi:hypothetical protein